MTVKELNRDQLNILRVDIMEKRGIPVFWQDIVDASGTISDEEVFREFEGYDFSIEDFGF